MRWRAIKRSCNRLPRPLRAPVIAPEQIFDFCRDRGFMLVSLRCGGVGLGGNEFVFERARA